MGTKADIIVTNKEAKTVAEKKKKRNGGVHRIILVEISMADLKAEQIAGTTCRNIR
jgi:hypothetical protein